MRAKTISFEADSYRVMEERDEVANPVMASWNAVAGCFGVKSGGQDGWPNGPAILEKAMENIAKFPERLGLTFKQGLGTYRASKSSPLPQACELKDEICK